VLAYIQASVTDLLTDYAKVGHWETGVRGAVGGGYTDDARIAARERYRWDIIADLSGVYRFNFDTIAALDPRLDITDVEDDVDVAGQVNAIAGGVHHGDLVHIDDSGFALLLAQFNTRADGLFSAGNTGRMSRYRGTRTR
jgi:hypothetical protein